MGTGLTFDQHGNPISLLEWERLFALRTEDLSNDSWWRRRTKIGDDVEVSTVWTGLSHGFGGGRPDIWETMIFGGDHDNWQWRYPTRAEALDDHERIVAKLRAGAPVGVL
jgi:hypothetical protein